VRRTLGRCLDLAFGLVVGAAVIALVVGAIAFGRGAVRFLEGRLDGRAHETDAVYLRANAAQAAMRSMALRRLAASRAATLYDSASVG
jgi:hypothetical protein